MSSRAVLTPSSTNVRDFLITYLSRRLQLFLEERVRSGELAKLWSVAVQTDLTFNLVRSWKCLFVVLTVPAVLALSGTGVTPATAVEQQQQ